jgi:hypothetical protein
MRKVLIMSLFCCLLVAISLLLPACGGGEKEGKLPTYHVGDTWTWSYVMEGTTYTLTEEVTGEETVEGRDCYVIDMSFDPEISYTQGGVVSTINSMTYWGDKATGLNEVKTEMSGTYDGTAFTMSTTCSYNPWVSIFPLEIGKEVETEKTTTQYFNGEQTGDPIVSTEAYEVDSKEDVTVAAGTLSCWKLIMYEDGDVFQTMWWSDKVKSMVKSTDADGNTMMELQSYSVD